jgi:hypothetical protein
MDEFSDFIFEQSFMDIPLQDGNSTWSNNRDLPLWSRINRFLISPKWEDHLPNVVQRKRRRSSFIFENTRLKTDGFMEKVRHWWSSYYFYGCPSLVLAQKLKALKAELKSWNDTKFGNAE